MKNKFILYVIALLLLCNAIFQFNQLSRIDAVGTDADSSERRNSSALSSFRRSQGKIIDSQNAIISELRNAIAAMRAENGNLRAQFQQMDRRLQPIERKLGSPPKR